MVVVREQGKPLRGIQDESEVRRWYEEGRTFAWMVEQYEQRGIAISPTTFSERARARGWARRILRHDDLLPWQVERKHRWQSIAQWLRVEGRIRAGASPEDLPDKMRHEWENFRLKLHNYNLVVDYSPEDGFFYTARLKSDKDIIRRPITGRSQRHGRG